MRTPALGLLVMLMASRVGAQEVRGVVVAEDTGSPIAGVTVALLAKDSTVQATATTTATGLFRLSVTSGGSYYLRASHALYTTSGDLMLKTDRHEIVNVVLRMGHATIPMEPLLVVARSYHRLSGFRERAAGPGQGRYILRAEIERRMPLRPTDLFKLESGVRLERQDIEGVSTEVLTMRSVGEDCEPAIYIDGVRLPPRVGPHGTSIDDLLTVEELEGVEIYRSHVAAPLELHVPSNACGVIAIWTRPARGGPPKWKRLGIAVLLAGTMFLILR